MELSLIALGFGMASVFGLIVGVFSVWNGRMTRREISRLIEEGNNRTNRLIEEGNNRVSNLIEEGNK
ncbi:MAG: hypothetical protein QMC83_03390, partial [Thermodesulfovibrionales bacterium]|nr:hypothetical protein [Thermodesulfovibrionales bacterium]